MPTPLTIVIVARNETRNLPRLITSIRRALPPDQVRILLADHGSTDATREVAREEGVDQIIEVQGGTIAEARNAGGFAVETDWMAFIDADCELAPDWWSRLSPHLQHSGIYGWPVAPPQPPTWVQAAWHTHWMTKCPPAPSLARRSTAKLSTFQTPNSDFRLITSAHLIIHRDLFRQLEGFDRNLASGEDQNLMLRAMQRDMPIQAVPGLTVIHHGEPRTLRDFFRQQLWHANRNSYTRILQETGLRQGGNAPLFTLLYLVGLALVTAGFVAWPFFGPRALFLALPWLMLITLPALRTSLRAKKMRHWVPLCLLYAAYGFARSLDLVGLNPVKKTWRI